MSNKNGKVPAGTAIPDEHTNNTCETILSDEDGRSQCVRL